MKITKAVFTTEDEQIITAIIDGIQMDIPANAGNRHYRELQRQKTKIATYVAPVEPVIDDGVTGE